jgi:ribosomal protein S18 acetylase RimI-like enzyme
MYTIAQAQAEVAHAQLLLALQKRAYASEARLYNDWQIPPLTQELPSLVSEIENQTVLVALEGTDIIGSVRASSAQGVCSIGRLVVEPAHQGRGLGTALLAAIEAAHPQATRFELFTGSQSASNIRLYERHGYRITHRKQLSPQVTLVFMAKPARA